MADGSFGWRQQTPPNPPRRGGNPLPQKRGNPLPQFLDSRTFGARSTVYFPKTSERNDIGTPTFWNQVTPLNNTTCRPTCRLTCDDVLSARTTGAVQLCTGLDFTKRRGHLTGPPTGWTGTRPRIVCGPAVSRIRTTSVSCTQTKASAMSDAPIASDTCVKSRQVQARVI